MTAPPGARVVKGSRCGAQLHNGRACQRRTKDGRCHLHPPFVARLDVPSDRLLIYLDAPISLNPGLALQRPQLVVNVRDALALARTIQTACTRMETP